MKALWAFRKSMSCSHHCDAFRRSQDILRKPQTDDPRRISRRHGISGDIVSHDAAHADDSTVPNGHARPDMDSLPDPDITSNNRLRGSRIVVQRCKILGNAVSSMVKGRRGRHPLHGMAARPADTWSAMEQKQSNAAIDKGTAITAVRIPPHRGIQNRTLRFHSGGLFKRGILHRFTRKLLPQLSPQIRNRHMQNSFMQKRRS